MEPDPNKKEIKYSLAAPAKQGNKRNSTITGPKYGCLKGGKQPTFKQFSRRSSLQVPKMKPSALPMTIKHYRRCGKIHNNTVRVILPDQKTLNGIEKDKKKLDKHTLATICDYLAKRNLYTAGSDVPEDILREIYKNAHLAGNVHNHDSDIMINNFMKGGEAKEV